MVLGGYRQLQYGGGSPRAFLLEGTVLLITPSQPPHAAASHVGIMGGFSKAAPPNHVPTGGESPLLPPLPRNQGDERGNNYPAPRDGAMFANRSKRRRPRQLSPLA